MERAECSVFYLRLRFICIIARWRLLGTFEAICVALALSQRADLHKEPLDVHISFPEEYDYCLCARACARVRRV